MTSSNWYVFAGGGTGGHLFPAMSVARALCALDVGAEVSFFCTQRPIDGQILGQAGIEAIPQVVLPFPAKPWRWPRFLLKWREAVRFCLQRFADRPPAVVVGAGGYASGPPVEAAARLGIPAFLLNPDAVPGRANRHMSARGKVRGVFAQWEVTRKHFPSGVNVEVVGCPVRPAFRDFSGADLGAMRASFDLHPDRPMLLVTGASQGARTVNEAVLPLAGALSIAGWQVLHLAGKADAEQVQRAYADGASGVPHRVLGFTDRMPEAMAAADLIISRAGASTLSEIQAAGRPSILFPYPYHRDQHQRHNAAVLADAGAAILLEDAKDGQVNAGRLGPPLALLMGDPARRLEMGRCARALDRPDSAERIAAHLLSAAQVPTNIPCEISDCHAAQRCSNTEY